MADITPQVLAQPPDFAALTWNTASSGGDQIVNSDGKIIILAKNANVSTTRTLTVHAQAACNHGTAHDVTKILPINSAIQVAGPFGTPRFNDASDEIELTYDDEADVSIAAFKVQDV